MPGDVIETLTHFGSFSSLPERAKKAGLLEPAAGREDGEWTWHPANAETAMKAAGEAKRGQRDEKDQVQAKRKLPNDRFRAVVGGKTEQQVRDALGKLDETQDREGQGESGSYRGDAADPGTGKTTALVQLGFEGGVVASVNFV